MYDSAARSRSGGRHRPPHVLSLPRARKVRHWCLLRFSSPLETRSVASLRLSSHHQFSCSRARVLGCDRAVLVGAHEVSMAGPWSWSDGAVLDWRSPRLCLAGCRLVGAGPGRAQVQFGERDGALDAWAASCPAGGCAEVSRPWCGCIVRYFGGGPESRTRVGWFVESFSVGLGRISDLATSSQIVRHHRDLYRNPGAQLLPTWWQ